jgi:hypothetical protein
MATRTKTLAAVTVGAAALASGAYAVGSTTGGGFAAASISPQSAGANVNTNDPWIEALAGKLGVQPSQLGDALDAIHNEQGQQGGPGGDPKDDIATALADALGVSKDKVVAALDKIAPRPTRPAEPKLHGDFAAKVAGKLGVDESKVKDALTNLRAGGGPPDFADLAKKLGVTDEKLKSALTDVRPNVGPGKPPGPGAPGIKFRTQGGPGIGPDSFAADLAKELGVDEAKVKAALDNLESAHQQQAQDRWDAFVKSLADKLGLTVQKVQQGLGSVPPRGFDGPGIP